ncbi:MAG: DMT family transporter [Clostridia bacterium]|nr:DMT family transporter [Clostridia bacterium]
MKTNNLKGTLILGVAAFIWGMAFVAQNMVSDTVPTFTISTFRSFIAAVVLLIFWKLTTLKLKENFFPEDKITRKKYYIAGLVCGVCLTIASNLQQFGMSLYPKDAPAEAHAGFLTALYVILVPIFSVFLRKKVGLLVWLGGILAAAGIYLLCFTGGIGGFYVGDIIVFTCSIAFAFHILSIDKYVGLTGGIKLSIMQFFVVGVFSLIGSLIFDRGTLTIYGLIDGALPILYLGIMSSGVAYTLQIVGQKYAQPAVASITMSFESVFAVLGGVLFSSGTLSLNEILGCAIMFVAIIIAQIPEILQSKKA